MKDRPTIPAPQHIKRREAYLLTNCDTLPKAYVQAQLLKIAKIRAEKRLRWQTPDIRLKTQEARLKETASTFVPVPQKKSIANRFKDWFKNKRGN